MVLSRSMFSIFGAAMPQSPSLRRAFCRKSQDRSRENGVSPTGTPPPLLRPIGHNGASPTKDLSIDAATSINYFSRERKAYSRSGLFREGLGCKLRPKEWFQAVVQCKEVMV